MVPIERRMNDESEACFVGAPHVVVVRSLDMERVFARRKVGVGDAVLIAKVRPLLFTVKAFEPYRELVFLGHGITEGSKTDADDVVAIGKVELRDGIEVLGQKFRTHGNLGLRTKVETCEDDFRGDAVVLDLRRIERLHTLRRAQIDASVGGAKNGVG